MALLRPVLLHLCGPALFSVFVLGGLIALYQDVSAALLSTAVAFVLVCSLLGGFVYLIKLAYNFLFYPLELYSDEAAAAYGIAKAAAGMTKAEAMEEIKRARKIGNDLPPVYPNGWFAVLRSAEVQKLETKYAYVVGLHLAVFRGKSGQSYVVDAHCVHMGANLAMGGKVGGECIECPFHGWAFRGSDGKCVKIVYSAKIPESAKVKTYPSLEVNGFIMVWYHSEGEEPSWYPPEVRQITTGEWFIHGFWESKVDAHIQDVTENSADVAHFDIVHGPQGFDKKFTLSVEFPGNHTMKVPTEVAFTAKTQRPWSWLHKRPRRSCSEQMGPGLTYIDYGSRYLFVTCTPIGPLRQKLTAICYGGGGILSRIAQRFRVYFSLAVVEGDVKIWANKMYRANPLFLKEDLPVSRYRRWFSQFYSENSPRYNAEYLLKW